jgi:periplasmic protein TonB
MSAYVIGLRDLPWTADPVAEQRFRRLVRRLGLVALVLCLIMPWLPLPEQDGAPPPELPDRYARLLMERRPLPPPPAPVADAPPEVVAEAPAPAAQPADTPRPRPAPAAPPVPSARERAAATGVMAFADALADLRSRESVAAAAPRELTAGAGESRQTERSLITAQAGHASSGINTASLSRDTGGGGLTGREVTQVAAPVGGGGRAAGGGATAGGSGSGRDGANARSREEIELVFDRNKSAIYALYNRALRSDPTLRGRLVLELTIAPNGEVTGCKVVSSDLSDPEFERRLVARVMLFRFEDKDVATMTTTKPIEFFPA